MNTLRQTLIDYLSVRRALGYKLERDEKLLTQFLTYLENLGQEHLCIETAVAWATLPAGAHHRWWANRLSTVRGFAAYLRTIDPATEVLPTDLLPSQPCRATPFHYSEEEITALLAATTPHGSNPVATRGGVVARDRPTAASSQHLDHGDLCQS